jgi:hypothetical protein
MAVPALAATAYKSGKYGGKTAQNKRISFTVDNQAAEVSKLKFKHTGTCSDGNVSDGRQGPFLLGISDAGKFHVKSTSPSGATHLTVNGKLAGKTASGNFTVKTSFNKKGKPDKNGKIHCTTGKVKWTATLGG